MPVVLSSRYIMLSAVCHEACSFIAPSHGGERSIKWNLLARKIAREPLAHTIDARYSSAVSCGQANQPAPLVRRPSRRFGSFPPCPAPCIADALCTWHLPFGRRGRADEAEQPGRCGFCPRSQRIARNSHAAATESTQTCASSVGGR